MYVQVCVLFLSSALSRGDSADDGGQVGEIGEGEFVLALALMAHVARIHSH